MTAPLIEITAIRMQRFEELRQEFADLPQEHELSEHGRLRRFGEFTGLSDRYLSHIVNGRKNIGHQTARALETAFRKPANWMDSLSDRNERKRPAKSS